MSGLPLLAAEEDPTSHILPHRIGEIGGFAITNQIVMLGVAALLMIVLFPLAARKRGRVPTGFRNLVESVLVYLRETVARPVLHSATDRYVPFLWTVFFFVLFANLLGAVPTDAFLSLATGRPTHVGGTATGNIMVTAGLAMCSFFAIHVGGIREQGLLHYLKNFVPHVHWSLLVLFIPLEILGALVKPFALAIRLFANMIAGHIVVAILLGFTALLASGIGGLSVGVSVASVVGATAISCLELFVAFLQAFIFTFLTTLFLGMAVHPEH